MIVFLPGDRLEFEYMNHRGVVEQRNVIFKGVDYGENEWYVEPQWFLRCHDTARNAPRSFALARIAMRAPSRLTDECTMDDDEPRVIARGKQVLLDKRHLADAVSEDVAKVIAICLEKAGLSMPELTREEFRLICRVFA